MESVQFILYVADQEQSMTFYKELLQIEPSLHVPGMTEFNLSDSCKLGLMPEQGIAKILSPKMKRPELGTGIPRCELYLKYPNAEEFHNRGIALGAEEISEFKMRDWGDSVGYLADVDGHVIAFASLRQAQGALTI
jgi:uncharacterized glyoxalase superfamily protein PhnB